MRTFWQDLTYAVRTLRANPGFAAVAIVSLALGIGANSAIFSFADAIMFRPLPVPRSSEVVNVFTSTKSARLDGISYPEYLEFRENAKSLNGVGAFKTSMLGLSLSADQVPELAVGALISGNLLDAMDVAPRFGRNFRPEEDAGAPGAHPVAIISDGAWERRFNRDPNVLGRTIRVNGKELTIIGVTPKVFTGVDHYLHTEVYVPLRMFEILPESVPAMLEDRGNRWLSILARLKPGVEPKAATAECAGIMGRLASAWPATNANRTALVLREGDARFQRSPGDGALARTLLIIVGLVLLIACGNAANLLLARATGRTREIAVRLAIGAGRWRLVRQLLTENLLLAGISGALGLVLAYWGVQALALVKIPNDLPIVLTPKLDARVIWYTVFVSIATGILFGLAPAWKTSRADLVPALRGVETGKGGRVRKVALRDVLVVGQVAFSVAALIFGGILMRAFMRVQTTDVGFRTEGILLAATNPGLARYSEERGAEFYRQLLERVKNKPGVQTAALASHIPFGIAGFRYTGVVIDGYELPADQENMAIATNSVSPGFFDTMKMRIVRGRDFDSRDTASSQPVMIVNETMVRNYWKGRDPVGSRVRLENRRGPEVVVIGVASDSKYQWVLESPMSYLYRPYTQSYVPRMTVLAANGQRGYDPAGLVEPVRSAVRSLDANLPVFDVRTFRTFYTDRALAPGRILTSMIGGLGGLGIALAMVGLYGVISYAIGRRTREIGIRMAIGADRQGVVRMVLRQGFVLGAIGIVIGVGVSAFLTPGMSPFLGKGAGTDPVVYLGVPEILVIAILVACWAPARRASKIDPWIALRYE